MVEYTTLIVQADKPQVINADLATYAQVGWTLHSFVPHKWFESYGSGDYKNLTVTHYLMVLKRTLHKDDDCSCVMCSSLAPSA